MTATPNAEWWRLDEGALWAAGEEIEARRRTDYVRQVEVVAELWARGGRGKDDHAAIVADLMDRWRVTRGEAKDLLRHAELFRSRDIHRAALEGVLSRQHLVVLDKTLTEAAEADREKVEAALLENAVEFDGASLRIIARRILQNLDQDGKAPDDRELAEPKREFHYSSRNDGSVVFRGKIDPESGAKLAALISPLAKPTSATDARTTPERQGDAFAEIIELAASSDDLPEEGGERPHLALTMSLKDFQQQRGTADVEGMGPMGAASVRRIACDCNCAIRRSVVSPAQLGGTWRTVPGSNGLPGVERQRGQEHAS